MMETGRTRREYSFLQRKETCENSKWLWAMRLDTPIAKNLVRELICWLRQS